MHLQVLHELGHLQSLPLVILTGVVLFLFVVPVLPATIGLFILWEILSEAYVIFREGRNYFRIYGISKH